MDQEQKWAIELKQARQQTARFNDIPIEIQRSNVQKAMLDAKMSGNPGLEYYDFWRVFCARHRRHSQAIQKRNWESVKLQKRGNFVTLQEWAEFVFNSEGNGSSSIPGTKTRTAAWSTQP